MNVENGLKHKETGVHIKDIDYPGPVNTEGRISTADLVMGRKEN